MNRGYYTRVTNALDASTKERLDRLFTRMNEGGRTLWDLIKSEPKQPTAKEIKRFVTHLNWLREQAGDLDPLAGIPVVKVNRFCRRGSDVECRSDERIDPRETVRFHGGPRFPTTDPELR